MQRNKHGKNTNAKNPPRKVERGVARPEDDSNGPRTRDFFETVRERAAHSPGYRTLMLQEAIGLLCEGDLGTAKLMLRDYVKVTIGFEGLAERTDISSKSLMRMLSVEGNPRASNLVRILHALQEYEGVTFKVESVGAA